MIKCCPGRVLMWQTTVILTLSCFVILLAPNECADGTDDCDPNAFCDDTFEGYQCTCRPGFTGNGKVCTGKLIMLDL